MRPAVFPYTIAVFVLLARGSFATMVGGLIATNTHWKVADSPFIAASSILIDNGATLIIDPGVEVRFAAATGVAVVNGTLVARGTEALPISFIANEPAETKRWNGIGFGATAVDAVFASDGGYLSGSVIEHATVKGIAEHFNGARQFEQRYCRDGGRRLTHHRQSNSE
jgi:hypothetical protein